jgi:hypothetical protein
MFPKTCTPGLFGGYEEYADPVLLYDRSTVQRHVRGM